jgi:hypothetical protein
MMSATFSPILLGPNKIPRLARKVHDDLEFSEMTFIIPVLLVFTQLDSTPLRTQLTMTHIYSKHKKMKREADKMAGVFG